MHGSLLARDDALGKEVERVKSINKKKRKDCTSKKNKQNDIEKGSPEGRETTELCMVT